jgi:hypothetical protein
MFVFSQLIAVGVPSDGNPLERCKARAWPEHGRNQCTLPTRKRERRRNIDAAILLSTPSAFHILCLLITQTLEKHRVNGDRKVWTAACNQVELRRRNDNGKSRN